jgi:DNA topoisomerase-3
MAELKRREFLETKGKQIISTTLGRSVIDALPEVVKSPVLTALYERMLKGIEQGTAELAAFIARSKRAFIRDQVAKANDRSRDHRRWQVKPRRVSTLHKCMACGTGLSRPADQEGKGQFLVGMQQLPHVQADLSRPERPARLQQGPQRPSRLPTRSNATTDREGARP